MPQVCQMISSRNWLQSRQYKQEDIYSTYELLNQFVHWKPGQKKTKILLYLRNYCYCQVEAVGQKNNFFWAYSDILLILNKFFYTFVWPPLRYIRLYITIVMGRPPPGIEIEACNEKITSYQLIKIRAMNGMWGKIIWVSSISDWKYDRNSDLKSHRLCRSLKNPGGTLHRLTVTITAENAGNASCRGNWRIGTARMNRSSMRLPSVLWVK